MKYIIGIDIGTTHTKSVMITTDGKVIYECKTGYPTQQPQPGYSEQDPAGIFSAVTQVIKETIAQVSAQQDILCISISAAMHSLMVVDENGNALTPIVTWADTRANQYAKKLRDTDLGSTIYRKSGTPIHPMSPLCKIAWICDNQPAIFSRAHKFISAKEYVLFKLLGKYVVDYSIASATGLFDSGRLQWSKEALHYCGITEAQLSMPVSPFSRFSITAENVRHELELTAEIPITIGGGDGGLANVGSGALLPGEAAVTIGTSGAVRIISDHSLALKGTQLFSYLLDEKTFFCGGAINNGGNVLKWLEGIVGLETSGENDINALLQKAEGVAAGSEGLVFLPYIHGERAPIWDAAARGVFIGITASHKREHFIRAVLEGICFSLLQVIESIERNELPLTLLYANGGFIESGFWVQMLADITQKPLSVSHAADASALGAAFTGMLAMGLIQEWITVKQFIEEGTIVSPSKNNKAYQRNYSVYKGLYEKLKEDFNRLNLPL